MLRKASKSLKNAKLWQNFTRAYLVLGIGANIFMAAYLEIYVFHVATDEKQNELLSCASYLWLTNNVGYMTMAIIFVIFAFKLNQTIQLHISKEKRVYGYEDSHFK